MRRVDLTVEGQPYSKARPRVTSRGTYTPKAQKMNAEVLAWEIRLACKHTPFEGAVEVALVFYRSNRQRIDLDNLVKQVLDAANGVAWEDDAQVTGIIARKRYDAQRPRTEIAIRGDANSNFETPIERLREAICGRCGVSFQYTPYPSQPVPRFCSPACRGEGDCAMCGQVFTKQSRPQRYCEECRPKARRAKDARAGERRKRQRAERRGACPECGGPMSRSAARCTRCWKDPERRRLRKLLPAN